MNNFKKFVIPFVLVLALVFGTISVSAEDSPVVLPAPKTAEATVSNVTYTGSAAKPKVVVTDDLGNTIASKYYTIECTDVNAGTATAVIRFVAPYSGTITKTFTINKATPKVTTSKKVKAKTVKKKAYKVTMVKGGAKVVKVSGSKKLTVSKSGVITVKKGTKKGTYKIKVKVYGNGNYKAVTKTITIKVK